MARRDRRVAATAAAAERRLRQVADPANAAFVLRFFKTGPGQYGEGDQFLGRRVPQVRAAAREFAALPPGEIERLLHSPWHEARLLALLIMVGQYLKGNAGERNILHRLYLANTAQVNNWDLVDASASTLVGLHFDGRHQRRLLRLARSRRLWERRIAIIATFHTIRQGRLDDTFAVATALLDDEHDLIHKAAGWMLREAGKRDQPALERFLDRHADRMPRTMLRYAIERFTPRRRGHYLRRGGSPR